MEKLHMVIENLGLHCFAGQHWGKTVFVRFNGHEAIFVHRQRSIPEHLAAADELNRRPRKKLGYRTPEELFDEFLDSVYAAEGCGSIA